MFSNIPTRIKSHAVQIIQNKWNTKELHSFDLEWVSWDCTLLQWKSIQKEMNLLTVCNNNNYGNLLLHRISFVPKFQPVEELQTDGTDLTNNTPWGQTTTTTTRNPLYTDRQMRNNNAQNISLSLLHFRTLRRINGLRLLWIHIWLTGQAGRDHNAKRENVEDNCEWRSLNWIASSVYLNDNHLIVRSDAWIELQQPLKSSTRTGDTRHTEVEKNKQAQSRKGRQSATIRLLTNCFNC